MAVKYLVSNGAWSNSSIWNNNSLPQDGDEIYLNGHSIGFANGQIINMPNSIFSNEPCPVTGISGGAVYCDRSASLIFSKIIGYRTLFSFPTNQQYDITADIYLSTTENTPLILLGYTGATSPITINGNIYTNSGYLVDYNLNTSAHTLTINGNIDKIDHLFIKRPNSISNPLTINGNIGIISEEICNYSTNVTINGNATFSNNIALINKLNISNLTITDSKTIYCTALTISGGITYTGTNANRGLETTSINIVNPSTFYWINTLDTPDYPAESDVKQGVTYAYGQKVGTYTPDFPQEANVLQGVTYDNGNKTGTLTPVILGDYPDVDKVLVGTIFDYGNKVGTLVPTADYPAEADVKQGVVYDYGQKEGTLSVSADYPPESVVMQGVEYAYGQKVGTMDVEVTSQNTINVYPYKRRT